MIVGNHRPSCLIIDRNAVRQNIKREQEKLGKDVVIFAVLKANAYGMGTLEIAQVAKESGVKGFCVAILDEAIALREAGFNDSILVMGVTDIKDVLLASQLNISLTMPSVAWLEEVSSKKLEKPLNVHVKLDTGMGRIGLIEEDDIQKTLAIFDKNSQLNLEGLFMHFAKADSEDLAHFNLQKERFTRMKRFFPDTIKYVHTSNSAAVIFRDAWGSNMVRFGFSMYGMNPTGKDLKMPYPVADALSIETALTHVKQLKKGESISYGATYYTKSDEWIGTLPFGYGDGFPRTLQGFEVIVEGEKTPIVGRMCMDQCMIRLPKEYPIGTKVTIVGKNGDQINTLQDMADHANTICAELLCRFTDRMPRYYIN